MGIDPGSQRIGVANIWLDVRKEIVSADNVAINVEKVDLPTLCNRVLSHIRDSGDLPAVIAIETPGAWLSPVKATRNLAGVAQLYQVIGALRVTCGLRYPNAEIRVVTDSEVKLANVGKASAHKYEVHRLLPMFGYTLHQLGRQTCAECRSMGYDDQHSPDGADAMSIAHCVATGRLPT